MRNDTDEEWERDEWKDYPLWSRVLVAVAFPGIGIFYGWLVDGRTVMILGGGVVGGMLAVLALFVPPSRPFVLLLFGLLSYCGA